MQGHSRSPLFPLSAAAGAPLASHAIEGSNDKEQEAHADGHGHDSYSGLRGRGGHCGDKIEEVSSVSSSPAAPWLLSHHRVTHKGRSRRHAGRSHVGWRPHRRCRVGSWHWSASGSGSCSPSPALREPALWTVETWVRPRPIRSRAGVMSSPSGSRRGDIMPGSAREQVSWDLGEGACIPECPLHCRPFRSR